MGCFRSLGETMKMTAVSLRALVVVLLAAISAAQQQPMAPSCPTLKYSLHKVSCLCGEVSICSGDICGIPSTYGLDDEITVELRDKTGATVIASTKVVEEERTEFETTQDNLRRAYSRRVRTFCFEEQRNGRYQLAFITHKNGVPQPAILFPTNYSASRYKTCDSVYMVEPACPKKLDNER